MATIKDRDFMVEERIFYREAIREWYAFTKPPGYKTACEVVIDLVHLDYFLKKIHCTEY